MQCALLVYIGLLTPPPLFFLVVGLARSGMGCRELTKPIESLFHVMVLINTFCFRTTIEWMPGDGRSLFRGTLTRSRSRRRDENRCQNHLLDGVVCGGH